MRTSSIITTLALSPMMVAAGGHKGPRGKMKSDCPLSGSFTCSWTSLKFIDGKILEASGDSTYLLENTNEKGELFGDGIFVTTQEHFYEVLVSSQALCTTNPRDETIAVCADITDATVGDVFFDDDCNGFTKNAYETANADNFGGYPLMAKVTCSRD